MFLCKSSLKLDNQYKSRNGWFSISHDFLWSISVSHAYILSLYFSLLNPSTVCVCVCVHMHCKILNAISFDRFGLYCLQCFGP